MRFILVLKMPYDIMSLFPEPTFPWLVYFLNLVFPLRMRIDTFSFEQTFFFWFASAINIGNKAKLSTWRSARNYDLNIPDQDQANGAREMSLQNWTHRYRVL